MRESREDGERGVVIELVSLVDIGNVFGFLAERRHLHVAIDAKGLAHRDRDVRRI